MSLGGDTVHLAALKLAAADADAYVLRCWDMYGQEATLDVRMFGGKTMYQRTDLLETAIAFDTPEELSPWQIATLKFSTIRKES